jgi:hypothetical protein
MSLFLILLQALALLTSPVEGATVNGQVNLVGSANDPQFARYELAFAYDPNPTDTWFEIAPPVTLPVTTGQLGVWDTTTITDGTYMLRLRVFSTQSNTPTEVIVRGIQVQNDVATPAPTAESGTLSPQITEAPIATLPFTPEPPTLVPAATDPPQPTLTAEPTAAPLPAFLNLSSYADAFCNGVYLTGAAFVIIAVYVIVRDRIRGPIRKWLRRVISDIRKP